MDTEYKRWLIGLDFTDMDAPLMRYVATLARLLEPTDVYFVHVEPDFEKPDYFPSEFAHTIPTIDEGQKATARTEVESFFRYENATVHVEIIEGKPFETLVHWASVKKIDLMVMGRKPSTDGDGILPHRLSRKLPCSVMFIPPDFKSLERVLVPVDFSKHSLLALQSAMQLQRLHTHLEVKCLHIYEIPTGYSKSGKSREEFGQIMLENAKMGYDRFLQRAHLSGIDCVYRLKEQTAAQMILSEAENQKASMIVLGSKGQTDSAVLFLGSVTEKLLSRNTHFPVWVVKMKDENIDLLKAIEMV